MQHTNQNSMGTASSDICITEPDAILVLKPDKEASRFDVRNEGGHRKADIVREAG